MAGKRRQDDADLSTVHFRLSKDDITLLDCCAKIEGLSRSAYVRKVVLSHIHSELADKSLNITEKIIRQTLETILDLKTKKEAQTLRRLVGEIQRANFMQLKDYIEKHPGLDLSEYRSYYYQCEKESYELSSGKRTFQSVLHIEPFNDNPSDSFSDSSESIPEWLKALSGENDD